MGNTESGVSAHDPGRCPLCHNVYRSPFTLKCNHRFCKGCIGELWSDSVTGPYYCPECKEEYRTLPFERDPVKPIHPVWRTRVNTLSDRWTSGKKNLLGKRAASSPAPCQPKRLATDHQGASGDGERPTTSVNPSRPLDPDLRPSRQPERPPFESPSGSSIPPSHSAAVSSTDMTKSKSPREATPQRETSTSLKNDASPAMPPAKEPLVSPMKTPEKMSTPAEKEKSTGRVSQTPTQANSPPPPSTPSSSPAHPSLPPRPVSPGTSSVPCHYCPDLSQRPAVKTCLVCGASMCSDHLRPHLEAPVFQSHTLVAPVEDMSPWRCAEHQEMTRIYCRQCDACVCTVCTVIGSHREHTCVSIREAERELRGNLKIKMVQLQETEQVLLNRVAELREKKQASQLVLREARTGVQQQYNAMREALEQEEQQALLCVSHEESRAVGSQEGQLSQLQNSLASVQQGLHTLEGLADATGAARVQEQAFIVEYSMVTQSVGERGCGVEELQAPEEVNQARLISLQKWTERRLDSLVIALPDRDPLRLLYGISPSLDPDTSHPKLLLSEENRKVAYTEAPQDYPEQGARFTGFPQVLASQALEEGRWYWEVEVPGELGRWKLGVCEGRIGRKGQKDDCRIGFNSYSWCLVSERGKVEALHNKVAHSISADELCRVGVFLDFEEGCLSFYRVTQEGTLTLLHSFQQRFTEPVYPALAVSKTRLTISDLFPTTATSD